MAHVNGVESFWAMLRHGYHGVYHKISLKHLQRYIDEYAGQAQPARTRHHRPDGARRRGHMVGRRLLYRKLVAIS